MGIQVGNGVTWILKVIMTIYNNAFKMLSGWKIAKFRTIKCHFKKLCIWLQVII